MAISDGDRLRGLIGEKIPDGGVAADTNFSDAEIDDLLAQAGSDIDRAAVEAWRIKAAMYANLVNVTEGNASRQMSDLHKHALLMVDRLSKSSSSLTQGRARIGVIRRRYIS